MSGSFPPAGTATQEAPSAALLDHARCFFSLLGTDAILEYLCRQARALAGADISVGSCLPVGEPWGRGLHVAVEDTCTAASPAISSAAFAVYRRLASRPELLALPRSEDTEAIFRGMLGADAPEGVLCAFPLLNRRLRLVGQLVLGTKGKQPPTPAVTALVSELASLASLALENAQRLTHARRDQDRLLLLAEATEEALWDWDLDSNAFWWGGGIQNILKDGSEVIGANPSWKLQRIHPADALTVKTSLERARASNASTWRMKYRFRRGDASWAVVEDRGYFLRDASGRAYRMLGALRDISESEWLEAQQGFLVQASSALAASLEVEKNLSLVADLAVTTVADGCAIVLFDVESGKPASVALAHRDRALAERVRRAIDEAVGVASSRAFAEQSTDARFVDSSLDWQRALLEHAPALTAVLELVDPVSALHVPLTTGGKVLGLVTLITSRASTRHYQAADLGFAEELARRCGVAVDKTRLYEQAQNAIRARDAFMAILGHELRNPLSPITTALHLMQLRDPRSRREREVIARQVKHLTRLVDDLLDVSRIERGKLELSKKPVQLGEVIAKAVEIASPLLEQRRHRLELQVAPTGLPVLGDETRLAQVVANLLTNAARYTDEGGEIWVSALRDGKDVVLRVRDNGIGMAQELVPRVFELFVQGPASVGRHQGGLGLGLSLVRNLVTLHGGTVEACSPGPGLGSEFVVRLPAMVVELLPSDDSSRAAQQASAAHPQRVLIVDDNADAAELLGEVLSARGHQIALAADGPRALMAAASFDPDVAILDIGLPVMDGYELARRLRAVLTRQPFLIALTGYGQQQDRTRAREAGFDEHCVKPVEPDRLIQLLEGVAAYQREQQSERR